MLAIEALFKKYSVVIQIFLSLSAVIFLCLDINRPLVDYDEATYAHVIIDTLKSSDVSTLNLSGHDWFEKPPLYLWITMGSVAVFGEHEFAFRIPSVIFGVLCCWLVFLITRKLTNNEFAASVAFLVLLFSNTFFVFARELRLDTAVIAAILAGLFYWIKGLENEKFFLWFFPAIAIGFLFKSVIAFLLLPIVFFFSLTRGQWIWLKSKYLWMGLGLSLVILLPWHVAESVRFGWAFWNEYLGHQVFHRAVSTMTGTNDYYDYLITLWVTMPWIQVLALGIVGVISLKFTKLSKRIPLNDIGALLLSSGFIVLLFTVQKSHLATYILPVFPLVAICIALMFHHVTLFSEDLNKVTSGLMVGVIVFAAFVVVGDMNAVVPEFTYEERAIGETYRKNPPAPLYALNWKVYETVNYYANTNLSSIDVHTAEGRVLKAPFYLFVDIAPETYFFYSIDRPAYEGLKILYQGKGFALIRGEKDLRLPNFLN